MLVRVLFALLGLVAMVTLLSGPLGPESYPLPVPFVLSIFVISLGMVIPWSRWIRWTSPGPNIGLLSKFLGWLGAVTALWALVDGEWVIASIHLVLPILALALWKRHIWAAWFWYLAPLGALALAITSLVDTFTGEDSVLVHWYAIQSHIGDLIGVIIGPLLSVTLAREITTYLRRPPSTPPGPLSAT